MYQPKDKLELRELIADEYIYLGNIDTSYIFDMSYLFLEFDEQSNDLNDLNNDICIISRKDFSGIETWNTSNVEDMSYMFYECTNFNKNISSWNTSRVINMRGMFFSCYEFNQPLNTWNVSNVKNMHCMFENCYNFNQDLSSWNTSNVEDMSGMFYNCRNFNQDLSSWNISNVKDKDCIFKNTLKEQIFKMKQMTVESSAYRVEYSTPNKKAYYQKKQTFCAGEEAWNKFANFVENLKKRIK